MHHQQQRVPPSKRSGEHRNPSLEYIHCIICSHTSMFFFFWFIVECTYLFNVVLTSEWPRISDKDFMSKPVSTHLVAKVCLSAWKFVFAKPHSLIKSFTIYRTICSFAVFIYGFQVSRFPTSVFCFINISTFLWRKYHPFFDIDYTCF